MRWLRAVDSSCVGRARSARRRGHRRRYRAVTFNRSVSAFFSRNEYESGPNGGRVVMASANSRALTAIHDFLRYQIREHGTGDALTVRRVVSEGSRAFESLISCPPCYRLTAELGRSRAYGRRS